MLTWLRARVAARRMGLRDRGYTQSHQETDADGKDFTSTNMHAGCWTRTRIGIKEDGTVVRWCYRCEVITSVVKPAKQKAPLIRLVKG